MMFHVAFLLVYGAAASDGGFSMMQKKTPASKSTLFEGDNLSPRLPSRRAGGNHALRSAHLQNAKETAARVRQAVAEKAKALLAQVHELQMPQGPPQEGEGEGNQTGEGEGKPLSDTVEACHKCGEAEKELIDAINEALKTHEEAEIAEELQSELEENHVLANEDFNTANNEYTQAVSEMCPMELEDDAEEAAFDDIVAAAKHLKEKAKLAQEKKALADANKTLVDEAKSQYDTAAAAAEEAELPMAAKKAAEEEACKNVLKKKKPAKDGEEEGEEPTKVEATKEEAAKAEPAKEEPAKGGANEEYYKAGRKGTNDCPEGYRLLDGIAECKKAAQVLGIQYEGSGRWNDSPNMCLTSQWDGRGIFFNKQPFGRPKSTQARICKKRGGS